MSIKNYFGKNYTGLLLCTTNHLKTQWLKRVVTYYSSKICGLAWVGWVLSRFCGWSLFTKFCSWLESFSSHAFHCTSISRPCSNHCRGQGINDWSYIVSLTLLRTGTGSVQPLFYWTKKNHRTHRTENEVKGGVLFLSMMELWKRYEYNDVQKKMK